MAKMLSDGNTKLAWVPTLTDVSAPTLAELTAEGALDISCLIGANDFTLGATGEDAVDDPALCAVGNDKAPGRINYEAAMNFFRGTGVDDDKAWDIFVAAGIGGYLVKRVGSSYKEPFAVGDEVQVYQVLTGTPMLLTEANKYIKFKVNFYVQSAGVDERAVVAA